VVGASGGTNSNARNSEVDRGAPWEVKATRPMARVKGETKEQGGGAKDSAKQKRAKR